MHWTSDGAMWDFLDAWQNPIRSSAQDTNPKLNHFLIVPEFGKDGVLNPCFTLSIKRLPHHPFI